MNDTSMTRKSDPKYDDDLVNKRYVDKSIKMLIDITHPVGETYGSANINFNPNITWVGEWIFEEEFSTEDYFYWTRVK